MVTPVRIWVRLRLKLPGYPGVCTLKIETIVGVLLTSLLASTLTIPVAASADPTCVDVLVLGSRGSGNKITDERGVGAPSNEFYSVFKPLVEGAGKSIDLWANGEAETAEETAQRYPAVGILGITWAGLTNRLRDTLSWTELESYRTSVEKEASTSNKRSKLLLPLAQTLNSCLPALVKGRRLLGPFIASLLQLSGPEP